MEYSLRKSAASLCSTHSTASGIRIDYIEAYTSSDRELVWQLTGLVDDPQVIAVAPGSPAETAGVKVGDNLLAINSTLVTELRASSSNTALLADQLEERLAATPAGQEITLKLRRHGQPLTLTFAGEQLCATRFILKTGKGITAYGDGKNVALSGKLIDFAQNADELAVFASHELAHIIARDDKAKSLRQRRAMEDRADALGADLMRCAGYDVERGLAIWHRYNKRDWLRWMRSPSHRNVPERIRRIKTHVKSTPKLCPPPVPSLPN